MQVKEVATMHALTIRADASVHEVARAMRESAIGIVPVLENGVPIGVITDRDIVTRVVADGLNVHATRAVEVMTPFTVSIGEDDELPEAEARMCSYRIRRLLVLDHDGKLAGILSIDDLASQGIDPVALSQILSDSTSCAVLETQPSFLS
jgi:CBS domain-containing protein